MTRPRFSTRRSPAQRPPHALQPAHMRFLQAILDRTCDELKIDRAALETRATRDFLGRQLLSMAPAETDAVDPVVAKLAARARTFGLSRAGRTPQS